MHINLLSSKIARHLDVLKLFVSIVLRTLGLQQLLHYDFNNPLLRSIRSGVSNSCPMLLLNLIRNN